MRTWLKPIWLLIPLVLTASACSKPALIPPKYEFEPKAITLHLKADPQLNLYQKSPHTLWLCIYQLRDPNTYNQLLEEKDGLPKLLACNRFDGSVTYAKGFFIQPGMEFKEDLDRAEGTKYVGLVGGYQVLQKDRVTRLFSIPVIEETKGFLSRTKTAMPSKLTINLNLGPQEIQEIRGK